MSQCGSKPEMSTTALVQIFGSNRMLASAVGEELAGCEWVGVPFCGGCTELPHIGARSLIANDAHPHLINLARVVREPTLNRQLRQRLRGTLFHEFELLSAQGRCREREGSALLFGERARADGRGDPDVAWAADYFVCCWMSRAGSAGTASEFNGSLSVRWNANGGDSSVRFRSAVGSLRGWRRVLERANFTCLDCFEFLSKCKDALRHGIYCDPPWPDAGDIYKHKFTLAMQRRLAQELAGHHKTRVVVRYGDHPLIRELYPTTHWTWRRLQGRKQTNEASDEVLILNGASMAAAEAA